MLHFFFFNSLENEDEKKEQNDGSGPNPSIKIEPAEPMEIANDNEDKLPNQPASKRKKKD